MQNIVRCQSGRRAISRSSGRMHLFAIGAATSPARAQPPVLSSHLGLSPSEHRKARGWVIIHDPPTEARPRKGTENKKSTQAAGARLGGRRGASAFVQLALDTETDEQVAIKFIQRGGRTSQRIIARELLNHRECAMHPHIVQLKVPPGPASSARPVPQSCTH